MTHDRKGIIEFYKKVWYQIQKPHGILLEKMNTPFKMDYKKLTEEHITLAKNLCHGDSWAWSTFFKILGADKDCAGYLRTHYARRLQKKNGAELDDFCSFLYSYLQKDNHYVLTILIETNQHFFSDYFRKVLKAAYTKFVQTYGDQSVLCPFDKEYPDTDDETLPKHTASEKENSDGLSDSAGSYTDFCRGIWKKNQLNYLSIWLDLALECKHRYIAAVLGISSDNAVAKRIGRFKDDVTFSADGTSTAQQLDRWLLHNITLQFAPESENRYLILHLPFDCSAPENCFIRLELRHKNGTPVSEATVSYNTANCPIINGCGELRLSDFHANLKRYRVGCVKVFDGNGNYSEFFPVFKKDRFHKILSNELFDKWASREADLLQFSIDFGMGLAWLLNCNLDYKRYGAPGKFLYPDLKPSPGEALILFAANSSYTGSSLPKYGFIFPLEWRYLPEYDNPHSSLLPEPLIDLAEKIARQHQVSRGWGLHPSFRIFHDNVDFSRQTAIAGRDDSAASAYLSLSAALVLAARKYTPVERIFASAQWNWDIGKLQRISQLENKLNLAGKWKGNPFFVASEQYEEAHQTAVQNNSNIQVVPVGNVDPGTFTAFHFLEPLRPTAISPLKTVSDGDYKQKRSTLLKKLVKEGNAVWNNEERAERNSFVILCGAPAMGKSILMSDLQIRYEKEHTVIAYACQAGDRNCTENFIKSLTWQFAVKSSRFAQQSLRNLAGLTRDAAPETMYRKLFYEPLIDNADPNISRHYYILVDGLDEDASGKIAQLLTAEDLQFPVNYTVVVSTRPVEPMFSMLQANATGVLNLAQEEAECVKDRNRFIINYIYSNDAIRRCWQESNYDDDELRAKIAGKDNSFLYAKYVLQAVAEGMYHFNQLDRELPVGLIAFYEQSFRYRFETPEDYDRVRPLLKLLLDNGAISVSEASIQLGMPAGRLVKMLQGYCVVNGDMLSLSDLSLRDWLQDSIKNPDFSIF